MDRRIRTESLRGAVFAGYSQALKHPYGSCRNELDRRFHAETLAGSGVGRNLVEGLHNFLSPGCGRAALD